MNTQAVAVVLAEVEATEIPEIPEMDLTERQSDFCFELKTMRGIHQRVALVLFDLYVKKGEDVPEAFLNGQW